MKSRFPVFPQETLASKALEIIAEGKVYGAFVVASDNLHAFLPWYSIAAGAERNVELKALYSFDLNDVFQPSAVLAGKTTGHPSGSHTTGSFDVDQNVIIAGMSDKENLTQLDPKRCRHVLSMVCTCGSSNKCVFNP
jgi:hypothetical protein